MRPLLFLLCLTGVPVCGCVRIVPSPFQDSDAQATDDAQTPTDGGADQDLFDAADSADAPDLGHYCLDDKQCDDQISCTLDQCDLQSHRCSNTPDNQVCQNGRYCDGVEICDPLKGCAAGDPITCSDNTACTVDSCVESQMSCAHVARDMDGDKDPDIHCSGGDCDDNDPTVSSLQPEICANGRDDNCNGVVDESTCVKPEHDTCGDALALAFDKPTSVSMSGATRDYPASCAPSALTTLRDVVAAVTIPDGSPMDLDVIAQVDSGQVFTALAGQCADASSELACGLCLPSSTSGSVSRFLARSVAPGSYPIYLLNDSAPNLTVTASLKPASTKPTNETCGTAQPITPGVPTSVLVVDAAKDLASSCSTSLGDLVYSFTIGMPHDVRVVASSMDGYGRPSISLRSESCATLADEITCKTDDNVGLFARSLPAGKWFVSVSATAPTLVSFDVVLEDPSQASADETCSTAPALTSGTPAIVSFDKHTLDVPAMCGTPSADAAYALSLAQNSDVLLLARYSQSDQGAIGLFSPACTKDALLTCASTYISPLRAIRHDLTAGDYRAVITALHSEPASLTAFVRPAKPPVEVLFADRCDDAVDIDLDGGSFEGNTTNSNADYAAECDQSGGAEFGAPDQMLRLTLPEKRRVILDMQGSTYQTLLNVRQGPTCPGTQMVNSCAVGYYQQRSFLDLTLDQGTYFIQIDGLNGDAGAWKLDVFTSKL